MRQFIGLILILSGSFLIVWWAVDAIRARLNYCRVNACYEQPDPPCLESHSESRLVPDTTTIDPATGGLKMGGGMHMEFDTVCDKYGPLPPKVRVRF